MVDGDLSMLASYAYKGNGVLPSGFKLPDIPIFKMAFIRKGVDKALVGDAIVDTGFDGAIYANIELAEYLEGLTPIKVENLVSAGQTIECELFKTRALIVDESLNPLLNLGSTKIYVPTDPRSISDDVLVGREIINEVKILLNGEKLTILK